MLRFPILEFWSEEDLYKLQVQAVSRFLKCDTPQAVEAYNKSNDRKAALIHVTC